MPDDYEVDVVKLKEKVGLLQKELDTLIKRLEGMATASISGADAEKLAKDIEGSLKEVYAELTGRDRSLILGKVC